MSEESKAVARRFAEEFVNQRKLNLAGDLFATELVDHTAPSEDMDAIEGLKQFFGSLQEGFPDFEVVVDDLFAEGNKVALRFTLRGTHTGPFLGIPPTGKRVTMPGIDIMRIEAGKIVEMWGNEDMLGMMQQLGAFSMPGESAQS